MRSISQLATWYLLVSQAGLSKTVATNTESTSIQEQFSPFYMRQQQGEDAVRPLSPSQFFEEIREVKELRIQGEAWTQCQQQELVWNMQGTATFRHNSQQTIDLIDMAHGLLERWGWQDSYFGELIKTYFPKGDEVVITSEGLGNFVAPKHHGRLSLALRPVGIASDGSQQAEPQNPTAMVPYDLNQAEECVQLGAPAITMDDAAIKPVGAVFGDMSSANSLTADVTYRSGKAICVTHFNIPKGAVKPTPHVAPQHTAEEHLMILGLLAMVGVLLTCLAGCLICAHCCRGSKNRLQAPAEEQQTDKLPRSSQQRRSQNRC